MTVEQSALWSEQRKLAGDVEVEILSKGQVAATSWCTASFFERQRSEDPQHVRAAARSPNLRMPSCLTMHEAQEEIAGQEHQKKTLSTFVLFAVAMPISRRHASNFT